MKKFIPFKKEIPFKTKIAEVTSISLEHNIHGCANNEISGDFIISGEYRVTDTSTSVQEFRFDLPFDIEMSDTSENTVQHKIIKKYVDDIVGNIQTILSTLTTVE